MSRMLPALLVTALIAVPALAGAQVAAPSAAPTGAINAQPGAPTASAPGATNAAPVIPPSGTLGAPPAGSKLAPNPSAAQAGQRARMATCNNTAGSRQLKGAARQSYMSACLSGKTTPATMMKVCNAQASQDKMSADARRTYLSGCLKTSG